MLYKTFYRISLIVPFVVPLLFYLNSLIFGMSKMARLLYMSLVIGGVQYLFFALFIFYLIGRLKTLRKIKLLFWLSPWLYVFFGSIGWYIKFYSIGYYDQMTMRSVDNMVGPFFFFLIYGLLFGYVYCFIIEIIYRAFKARGWVFVKEQSKTLVR